MAKKIYTVRLIVTNDDGEITVGVAVDTDAEKLKTAFDYYFAAYLKSVSVEHAKEIVSSSQYLAKMQEKLSLCVCDE